MREIHIKGLIKHMKFRCVKNLLVTSLLITISLSCRSSNESLISCSNSANIGVAVSNVDLTLRGQSREYLVHFQSSSSGWVFESYLFIGEFEGQYIIASVANNVIQKRESISSSYFHELSVDALKLVKSNPKFNTEENAYCQLIITKNKGEVNHLEILGISADQELRDLTRKLDTLILYKESHQ